jgi:hypothetical protein
MEKRVRFIRWMVLSALVSGGITPQAKAADEPSYLKLETEVIKRLYCAGEGMCLRNCPEGEGAITRDLQLIMNLRLIYTNTGERPLILQKGSDLIEYITVSRSLQDLAVKKYEVDMSVSWYSSGSGDVLERGTVPSSQFVLLRPGEKYGTEGEVRIIDYARFLGEGEHVLQIVVPTWTGTREQAERLQRKWERTGVLWFKNSFSEPMAFTVEKKAKIVICP